MSTLGPFVRPTREPRTRMSEGPGAMLEAGWVERLWWEVYGPTLRTRELAGRAWIDTLAHAWCLVRAESSLTVLQVAEQRDMVDTLMGRRFLATRAIGVSPFAGIDTTIIDI